MVSIHQKWSKEGTVVNWQQCYGLPRLTDARGEQRLTCVVWSNRQATVAQIAQEFKVVLIEWCQNTQCIAADQSGCPCWNLSTAERANNGHLSIRTGPRSNGRRCPGLTNHVFFYITWMAGCVCVAYLGNKWHQDALWKKTMKVLLVQKVWAPVTVEFVVVYSDCVCVSVNVWSHTHWVVYFFLLSTNTTQHLHIHKFCVNGLFQALNMAKQQCK